MCFSQNVFPGPGWSLASTVEIIIILSPLQARDHHTILWCSHVSLYGSLVQPHNFETVTTLRAGAEFVWWPLKYSFSVPKSAYILRSRRRTTIPHRAWSHITETPQRSCPCSIIHRRAKPDFQWERFDRKRSTWSSNHRRRTQDHHKRNLICLLDLQASKFIKIQ